MSERRFVLRGGQLRPAPSGLPSGLAHGYGVFETVRAYKGRMFHLPAHLARMRVGAERLRLAGPGGDEGIERACEEALARAELGDARVRLICVASRGGSDLWARPGMLANELLIDVEPIDPSLIAIRQTGVSAIVSSHRINENSATAGIKTIGYAGHILAKRQAIECGAYEAIILNCQGHVVEGSMSNVFIVWEGALFTPATETGCLPGVTRYLVIELARGAGMEINETRFELSAIFRADECLLTSSIAEIVPVVRLNGQPVGDGEPGEITYELQKAFRRVTKG